MRPFINILFCACIGLAVLACNSNNKGDLTMNAEYGQTQSILGLRIADDRFFKYDENMEDEIVDYVADSGFSGIALECPSRVMVKDQDRLPLILVSRSDGLRDLLIDLEENATLVGVDLESGAILTKPAFFSRKAKAAPPRRPEETAEALEPLSPEDRDAFASQITTSSRFINARELLAIPWHQGEWAFAVTDFDWYSNVVVTRLEGEKAPSEASAAGHAAPLSAGRKGGLPVFTKVPGTPDAPGEGIVLKVPETVGTDPFDLNIYGSFTIPAKSFHLLDPSGLKGGAATDVPAAAVPVGLLICTPGKPLPIKLDLLLPVFMDSVPAIGTPLAGFFGIDTGQMLGRELPGGDYVVYGVVDRFITGPYRFTVK